MPKSSTPRSPWVGIAALAGALLLPLAVLIGVTVAGSHSNQSSTNQVSADSRAKNAASHGNESAPLTSVAPWREIHEGVTAYTGDDGGDATTLTVCDSPQSYLKSTDGVVGPGHCSHEAEGVSVTIASNDVVAIDHVNSGPDYVVKIKSDDSSWTGWTSTLGIKPRIPVNAELTVEDDITVLAPARDSKFGTGEKLAKGTIVKLISQDPQSDDLYVGVKDHSGNNGSKGWIDSLDVADGVLFLPGTSTRVTYQFDCDDLAPVSHAYETGNYAEAFKEIAPLATPACPAAEHLLAVMYGKGQGVKQDLVRAYALLLLAEVGEITPNGGNAAVIPVLGDDPNKAEIVQFAQTLSPYQLAKGEELALRLAPPTKDQEESIPHLVDRLHGALGQHYELTKAAPACFKLQELTGLLSAFADGNISGDEQIQDYMNDHGCTLLPPHIPLIVTRTDEDDQAVCVSQSDAQSDDGEVRTGQFCPGLWVPSSAVRKDH